jgi:hypothetical protein
MDQASRAMVECFGAKYVSLHVRVRLATSQSRDDMVVIVTELPSICMRTPSNSVKKMLKQNITQMEKMLMP